LKKFFIVNDRAIEEGVKFGPLKRLLIGFLDCRKKDFVDKVTKGCD